MGNCASAPSPLPATSTRQPLRGETTSEQQPSSLRASSSKRLSEQLSIARRASRELVKRMSSEAMQTPACFQGAQHKDETKRRGGGYAHRVVTDFETESVVGDLAETHTIPEMMVATLQSSHSMTTVESDVYSELDEGGGAIKPPRLPPPRKGVFSDDTPDTAIMSHFVNADAAISGMHRY